MSTPSRVRHDMSHGTWAQSDTCHVHGRRPLDGELRVLVEDQVQGLGLRAAAPQRRHRQRRPVLRSCVASSRVNRRFQCCIGQQLLVTIENKSRCSRI